LLAIDAKATKRPSALIAGISLLLLASAPLLSTLIRSVTPDWAEAARTPDVKVMSAIHETELTASLIAHLSVDVRPLQMPAEHDCFLVHRDVTFGGTEVAFCQRLSGDRQGGNGWSRRQDSRHASTRVRCDMGVQIGVVHPARWVAPTGDENSRRNV
jgi:hypothetical protein